jgi:hypothetical protein
MLSETILASPNVTFLSSRTILNASYHSFLVMERVEKSIHKKVPTTSTPITMEVLEKMDCVVPQHSLPPIVQAYSHAVFIYLGRWWSRLRPEVWTQSIYVIFCWVLKDFYATVTWRLVQRGKIYGEFKSGYIDIQLSEHLQHLYEVRT